MSRILCPYCEVHRGKQTWSQYFKEGNYVLRKFDCICGHAFFTKEMISVKRAKNALQSNRSDSS